MYCCWYIRVLYSSYYAGGSALVFRLRSIYPWGKKNKVGTREKEVRWDRFYETVGFIAFARRMCTWFKRTHPSAPPWRWPLESTLYPSTISLSALALRLCNLFHHRSYIYFTDKLSFVRSTTLSRVYALYSSYRYSLCIFPCSGCRINKSLAWET